MREANAVSWWASLGRLMGGTMRREPTCSNRGNVPEAKAHSPRAERPKKVVDLWNYFVLQWLLPGKL